MSTYFNRANAYASMSRESSALSASPTQLITLLFDGARDAIALARLQMQQGDIEAKGRAIAKAIGIVDEGLKAALDPEAGGAAGAELCANLEALYVYIIKRLLQANLHNDSNALDEADRLLENIGSAWREIQHKPFFPEAAEAQNQALNA